MLALGRDLVKLFGEKDMKRLCWVYRYEGFDNDCLLLCEAGTDLFYDHKDVMHVLNGGWTMDIQEDGSVTSKYHDPSQKFVLEGFILVEPTQDRNRNWTINWQDALARFRAGERSDPTLCLCCMGAGKIVPNDVVVRTARAGGFHVLAPVTRF